MQTAAGECEADALRISRFGWVYCVRHSSVSDALLNSAEGAARYCRRLQVGTGHPKNEATPNLVRVSTNERGLERLTLLGF